MESPDALRQRVHREVQLKSRLRLTVTRLDDANRERVWAVAAAHKAGLSIRQIAEAAGLSSSRVHQILHDNEAHGIPDWLDDLSTRASPADDPQTIGKSTSAQILLSTQVAILRRCIDWLKQLESERWVVEELRPITEVGGERVLLDRPQVLRILSRIASELDGLAGRPPPGSPGTAMDEMDMRRWLRQRMTDIDAPERKREQRVAIRKAANSARWRNT
jgi:Homeodomain-like domain